MGLLMRYLVVDGWELGVDSLGVLELRVDCWELRETRVEIRETNS